jgi:DNA-binding transcriptional ArsR family regulator
MDELYVKIRYKDIEAEFKGTPDEIYQAITRWIVNFIPSLDIASKLMYDIDFGKLAETLSNYVFITKDGDVILKDSANTLSLHNKILLVLSTLRLLEFLGKREKSSIPLDELSKIIASTPKTSSSRLSELRNLGYVERERENRSVFYKITIKGLLYLQNRLRTTE